MGSALMYPSRHSWENTPLTVLFSHTRQNPIWLLPRQPQSPSTAPLANLLPFLGHLTEPLDDQQWWQSASSMYTKPQWSHDLLYTCCCCLWGNSHSTPLFQPLSGQAKVKKEIFLLLSADATLQRQFPLFSSFPAISGGKTPKLKYECNE